MLDDEIIILNNGYLIQLLHEHIPSLQLFGKNLKNKKKWKALGGILKLIDYQLSHSLNGHYFELSQKDKRENHYYNDYFSEYLYLIFYETTYIKKEKARDYHYREYFKEILYKCMRFIIENDKFDKLFETYTINLKEPKKSKYYPNIKFSESLFYDEKSLDFEQTLSTDYENADYSKPEKFKNTKYFNFMKKAPVHLTEKKDVRKIYRYSQRKYEGLQKCEDIIFTFDFKTCRKKIKKNNQAYKLDKHLHTNLILDNESLKKGILNLEIKSIDDIFIKFILIRIIKEFNFGDNYILYEVSNFRYLSKRELNSINFQSMKKEYRKFIFTNQYDYDINAGAPTLLYQYIQQKLPDENIKLESLEKYIANRNIIREEAARLLEEKCSGKDTEKFKKQVKEVITAALYGSDILNKKSNLKMTHYNRKYLYENYLEFRNLIDDVTKLFAYYKKYLQPFYKKGDFIQMPNGNIELYTFEDGKKTKKGLASVVSGFYFSMESQILKLIYDNYKEDISLLMHDGFIARIDIDTNILEKLVIDNLGYKVIYEKEKLI